MIRQLMDNIARQNGQVMSLGITILGATTVHSGSVLRLALTGLVGLVQIYITIDTEGPTTCAPLLGTPARDGNHEAASFGIPASSLHSFGMDVAVQSGQDTGSPDSKAY